MCLPYAVVTPAWADDEIALDQALTQMGLQQSGGQGAQPGSYLPGIFGMLPEWLRQLIADLARRFNMDWRLIFAALAVLLFLVLASLINGR